MKPGFSSLIVDIGHSLIRIIYLMKKNNYYQLYSIYFIQQKPHSIVNSNTFDICTRGVPSMVWLPLYSLHVKILFIPSIKKRAAKNKNKMRI